MSVKQTTLKENFPLKGKVYIPEKKWKLSLNRRTKIQAIGLSEPILRGHLNPGIG